MTDEFSHYTFATVTQSTAHSATDTNPKIRLFGEKGNSEVFVTMSSPSHHDSWEGGQRDFGKLKIKDLGKIYAIDLIVEDTNVWRPASITLWRVMVSDSYKDKSVFTNPNDIAIGKKTTSFYLPLIDITHPTQGDPISDFYFSDWIVKDNRLKSVDQTIEKTELINIKNKLIKSTEDFISNKTKLTIANETTIKSGGIITPSIDSKFSAELVNELTTQLNKYNEYTSETSIEMGQTTEYTFPAHALTFFRYKIAVKYKTQNIVFYNGESEKVIIPFYDEWSGFDGVPAEWADIKNDEAMTPEFKDIYKKYFGHDWVSNSYGK